MFACFLSQTPQTHRVHFADMATKKLPVVHVAVVGLTSSSFPGTSGQGAGKSVLCNRFVRPKRDDLCLNHSSIMTNSDFGSSMVNNDHHLYWGEKIAALEDGSVSFQVNPEISASLPPLERTGALYIVHRHSSLQVFVYVRMYRCSFLYMCSGAPLNCTLEGQKHVSILERGPY